MVYLVLAAHVKNEDKKNSGSFIELSPFFCYCFLSVVLGIYFGSQAAAVQSQYCSWTKSNASFNNARCPVRCYCRRARSSCLTYGRLRLILLVKISKRHESLEVSHF